MTAPRGITQPPTSFIGSQCQGIHHAPLNTYNTKQLKILGRIKNCIINAHKQHPPPQGKPAPLYARCSQPLSTNQTPHPTTKAGQQQPTPNRIRGATPTGATDLSPVSRTGRRDSGPVVSKPNSVSGNSITAQSSRSRIPLRINVCCAPDPHPLQVKGHPQNRPRSPNSHSRGRAWVSWCSLERR